MTTTHLRQQIARIDEELAAPDWHKGHNPQRINAWLLWMRQRLANDLASAELRERWGEAWREGLERPVVQERAA